MAVSHRTNRLKLIGTPAVEQLQNGRYQLTVNCTTMNSREDWYSSNKARIFPDFGSLESAEMSIDGLAPRTGEAYTDMRLVSVQSSTQQEQYIVTLVYQTLGASFVQVKDDTVNYVENGLRRVTRESIAKAGTDFQKTVGTTSITSQIDTETAVTCVLANYEVNDTDSYREVTEIYLESGILSLSTPLVGGSQRVEVSALNLTSSEVDALLSEVTTDHKLIDESVSDFKGIKTFRYTFEVDDFEVRSKTENGLQMLTRTELSASNFSDGTIGVDTYTGLTLAGEEIDNGNTIKNRITRWMEPGIIDKAESEGLPELPSTKTHTWLASGVEPTLPGIVISKQKSNIGGFTVYRYTSISSSSDGDPTVGTDLTYQEEIEVKKPGLASLEFFSSLGGNYSGSTVFANLKPPLVSKIKATVNVSITSSQTADDIVAYNLSDVFVNLVTVQSTSTPKGERQTSAGFPTGLLFGGNLSVSQRPLPYYTKSTTANETKSGTTSIPSFQTKSGAVHNSVITKTMSLKGSGPITETGIYKSDVVPVFRSLDGTQYYRKTNHVV